MSEVGRPTELTEELTFKIRKLVLEGQTYKNIQEILEISPDTWDGWVWRDYKGFRKQLVDWDKEIMVDRAKENLHTLLASEDERVQADMTKFTLSTLAKSDFSSKVETEISGKLTTETEITDEQFDRIIRTRAEKLNS